MLFQIVSAKSSDQKSAFASNIYKMIFSNHLIFFFVQGRIRFKVATRILGMGLIQLMHHAWSSGLKKAKKNTEAQGAHNVTLN